MKAHLSPHNPMQALIKAIFEVRPPVLKGIKIDVEPYGLEVVRLEVELKPELIQAWAEKCKEIGSTGNPFPQPPTERKAL